MTPDDAFPNPTPAPVTEQMEGNDPAADVASPTDELAAENERLRGEVAALREQALRQAAEFQNYRRRTDAELGQAAARGRADALTPLLDVLDDLRRSIAAAELAAAQGGAEGTGGPAFDALLQGMELVYRKFAEAVARQGVEPIAAEGQPFDEALHEAVLQQPAPDPATLSGTVLAEVQPGYRMGERVLRHARVIVAQ